MAEKKAGKIPASNPGMKRARKAANDAVKQHAKEAGVPTTKPKKKP